MGIDVCYSNHRTYRGQGTAQSNVSCCQPRASWSLSWACSTEVMDHHIFAFVAELYFKLFWIGAVDQLPDRGGMAQQRRGDLLGDTRKFAVFSQRMRTMRCLIGRPRARVDSASSDRRDRLLGNWHDPARDIDQPIRKIEL